MQENPVQEQPPSPPLPQKRKSSLLARLGFSSRRRSSPDATKKVAKPSLQRGRSDTTATQLASSRSMRMVDLTPDDHHHEGGKDVLDVMGETSDISQWFQQCSK